MRSGMHSRFVLYAVVATLAVGGVAVAADALFVSDAEQVEQLADDLTRRESGSRVDAVLRWIDPAREPVTITVGRNVRRFTEDEDYALADELADALAPFEARELEVVQRSVRIDGERGTVAVRVRASGRIHDATLHLVKNGQSWLVTDVRTH